MAMGWAVANLLATLSCLALLSPFLFVREFVCRYAAVWTAPLRFFDMPRLPIASKVDVEGLQTGSQSVRKVKLWRAWSRGEPSRAHKNHNVFSFIELQ